MKKKRKFAEGGQFELSDEARAAGLSIGRNERISDADREAAIAETTGPGSKGFKRLSDKEAADLMEREVNMPEAVAIPVPRPRALTGREVPAPSRRNQNDYSMNEQEGSGRGTNTRAPSRGSYDQPGPIQGIIDRATESRGRVAPRERIPESTSSVTPQITSRRPRPMSRAERDAMNASPFKKGGAVKAKRGDGIAQRGKTKGRFV